MLQTQNGAAEIQHRLLARACDDAAKEYDILYKTFTQLDAKAQGTVAIAGIAIAASVAFVKPELLVPVVKDFGVLGYILICLPAVLGLFTLYFCRETLLLRAIEIPFQSRVQFQEIDDILQLDFQDVNAELSILFQRRRTNRWKKALTSVRIINKAKADSLMRAQKSLFSTIALLLLVYATILCHIK